MNNNIFNSPDRQYPKNVSYGKRGSGQQTEDIPYKGSYGGRVSPGAGDFIAHAEVRQNKSVFQSGTVRGSETPFSYPQSETHRFEANRSRAVSRQSSDFLSQPQPRPADRFTRTSEPKKNNTGAGQRGQQRASSPSRDIHSSRSTGRASAKKKPRRFDISSAKGAVAVFAAILVFTLLLNIAVPDKSRSETENRSLAQLPTLNLEAVKSGDFMGDFDTYMSDQFVGRNLIVKIKSRLDRAMGKKTQNGVYIGKEDWLFEAPTPYNNQQVKGITDAINAFTKKTKLKSSMVLSPNASYVMSEMLPKYVEFPDQGESIKKLQALLKNGMTCPDVASALVNGKAENQMFYRTDHHWTTRAARLAFDELAKTWGLDTSKAGYSFYPISTDFTGTLSSSSGVYKAQDVVEICIPKDFAGSYILRNTDRQQKLSSVFDATKLEQKNKYEVFFGGNFSLLEISTTNRNDRSLLVFKDSYANCLLPMLIPYFEEIIVIDPRYFTDELSSVLETYNFTHLLFVYNLDTLLEDNSLAGVLNSIKK